METPTSENLLNREFSELGAALRRRMDTIRDKWMQQVRHHLPKAHEMTFADLRNNMPELLEQVAELLGRTGLDPLMQLVAVSPEHGRTRFEQDYNINEMMIEYNLLRQVVFIEVSQELGRSFDMAETCALNLALDIGLRQATVSFVDHLAAQLQAGAESHAKYLSFLSHDIRGGLHSLLLMVEVLQADLGSAPQFSQSLKDLSAMKRSIHETVETMNRFLSAEKLRKGMFSAHPEQLKLQPLVEEILHMARVHAAAKSLDLRNEVDERAVAWTDRQLLILVLQNLVNNAVKFTDRGLVRIRSADSRDEKLGMMTIAVEDEGPGIAAEQLEGLFQPYVQGETHGRPGTGLGLSIARQAADLIGATVWAESVVGKGSTFYVSMPRTREAAAKKLRATGGAAANPA